MADRTGGDEHATALVVGEALWGDAAAAGIPAIRFHDWRAGLIRLEGGGLAMPGGAVAGLLLSGSEAAALRGDRALLALLDGADVPIAELDTPATPAGIASKACALLVASRDAAVRAAADERAALAELRRAHMQVQTDHAELETWLWDALAPKQRLARSWPPTAATLALGESGALQPLPVPARGLISVDVHLAESAPGDGVIALRLKRPAGPDFDGASADVPVPAGASGWFRLSLPRAPGGMAEDAVLSLSYSQPDGAALVLSLAPETPFPDFRLDAGAGPLSAPLAMRVHQTLPHMPAPARGDPRFGIPADGETVLVTPDLLHAPVQLPYFRSRVRRRLRAYPDETKVEYWEKENAVLVFPSTRRPVVARLPGLRVERAVQLRGITCLSRHDTMPVAFAIGAVPAGTVNSVEEALAHLGDWVHLLPGEWGEVWADPPAPLTGEVDLLLATAMPNMPFNRNAQALFHGFRVTSRPAPDGQGPSE